MIYDYIVIGSGFGGSVSALRLAGSGNTNADAGYVAPTVIKDIKPEDPVMHDIWLRYPPYTKFKTRVVSWLMS